MILGSNSILNQWQTGRSEREERVVVSVAIVRIHGIKIAPMIDSGGDDMSAEKTRTEKPVDKKRRVLPPPRTRSMKEEAP